MIGMAHDRLLYADPAHQRLLDQGWGGSRFGELLGLVEREGHSQSGSGPAAGGDETNS